MDDWKYFLGDDIWLHLKKEKDGDVGVELRMDGEEVSTFWLAPDHARIIGKKIQDLADSDLR